MLCLNNYIIILSEDQYVHDNKNVQHNINLERKKCMYKYHKKKVVTS